ncbi:hypothetical protein KAU43_05660 [candidate division WOR-3 bacterium]|jgi:hypothetical protein|nr:hypothetical protein [candidate division WOR-3 bacterium]
MKKLLAIVLLLPIYINAVEFLVSPPKLEFNLIQRKVVNDSLIVVNRDSSNITIKCYFKDWGYKNGKKYYTKPGSLSYSASHWITVNPLQFELLPYEKRIIRITLTKPDTVYKGEYRSMIFFETIAKPSSYSNMFMFNARIGVPLYAEIDRKEYIGFIEGIHCIENEIDIQYVNYSYNRLYLNGNYLIINEKNDTIINDSIRNILILPRDTQNINVDISNVEKGEYTVMFYIDNGGNEIAGGKKRFVKK